MLLKSFPRPVLVPLKKETVVAVIQANAQCACEALVAVWASGQTVDEKLGRYTSHLNKMGFNQYDARFASSLAEQINKGRTLTNKQMVHVKKLAVKYSGQVAQLLNASL